MKNIYLIVFAFLFFNECQSQQEIIFTNDKYNNLHFNPATAGDYSELKKGGVFASYRNQWMGFEGAPTTLFLGGDILFKDQNLGAGLTAFRDEIGINSRLEFSGSIAYKMRMSEGYLSGGLRVGFASIRSNFSNVQNVDAGDVYDNSNQSFSSFSVGFGVFYRDETLKIGLSIPRIVSLGNAIANDFQKPHLHSHLSLLLGEEYNTLRFEPTILFKYYQAAPLQTKFGLTVWINEIIGPAIYYRTSDALALAVSLKLQDQLFVSLAYDLTTSQLKNYSDNTLEITLGYRFKE